MELPVLRPEIFTKHMQKFGLQTNRSSQYTAIELEIAREQASALGRAGRKLRLSLENYQLKLHKGIDSSEEQKLLKEISENVWALILQREFLGFIKDNMMWIRQNYLIPEAAINSLGKLS